MRILTTQPGWILALEDYDENVILSVMVADGPCEDDILDSLRELAYESRHPRGGKNTLEWQEVCGEWEAEGRWCSERYTIKPFTVLVMG